MDGTTVLDDDGRDPAFRQRERERMRERESESQGLILSSTTVVSLSYYPYPPLFSSSFIGFILSKSRDSN